jgi:hypothetical protein
VRCDAEVAVSNDWKPFLDAQVTTRDVDVVVDGVDVHSTVSTLTPPKHDKEFLFKIESGDLFVRSEYVSLAECCDRLLASGTTDIGLTGTPGVGKSVFGVYYARHLLRCNDSFPLYYLVHGSSAQMLVRLRPGPQVSFETRLNVILRRIPAHALVITDGDHGATPSYRCRILYISSPKVEAFKQFCKRATRVFMSPWTREEVELYLQVTPTLPAGLSPDTVRRRFEKEGGVLRSLLRDPNDPGRLEATLQSPAMWRKAFEVPSPLDVHDSAQMLHQLVHIFVKDNNHLSFSTMFASAYVQGRLLAAATKEDFLSIARLVPQQGALGGHLFESFFHDLVAKVPTMQFEARRLEHEATRGRGRPRSDPEAHAASTEAVSLFSADELKQHPFRRQDYAPGQDSTPAAEAGVYYVPAAPNEKGIDSFCRGALFQVTVNNTHPVVLEDYFVRAAQGGDETQVVRLYFVVPHSTMSTFGKQHVTVGRRMSTCVEQWVLGVKTARYTKAELDAMFDEHGKDRTA